MAVYLSTSKELLFSLVEDFPRDFTMSLAQNLPYQVSYLLASIYTSTI